MLKVRAGEHPERRQGGQLPGQFSAGAQHTEGPAARGVSGGLQVTLVCEGDLPTEGHSTPTPILRAAT